MPFACCAGLMGHERRTWEYGMRAATQRLTSILHKRCLHCLMQGESDIRTFTLEGAYLCTVPPR